MTIYPAILTGSQREAQQEIMWIASYPKIRTVHFDVIDGLFVDNVTLTPTDLPELDWGELSIDLHLMTEEPLDYVYEAIEFKANLPIRAMIAQVERMSSQADFIDMVKSNQWQVGVSLDAFTPFEAIDEETWHSLDIVQLMGIEAGFQGQAFRPQTLERIKDLVALRKQLGREFEIVIDGGVKPAIIEALESAGAEGAVVGSALWEADDLTEAVTNLIEG